MHTDLPNHPQAAVQLHTGSFQFVRPSMGAWVLYGLGTENQDLPGFITINPITRVGGAVNFGSAFLPAPFQGTPIGGEGQSLANAAIPNIANRALSREQQRKQLDLLQSINRDRLARGQGQQRAGRRDRVVRAGLPHADRRAEAHGLQRTNRPARSKTYGIGDGPTDNFGRQCLLARRFAEAGVRFIELGHGGWDQHGNLQDRLTANCTADRPADRRPARRPQAARHAQGHAGRLGRRVRPHAARPERPTAATTTPTGFTMWLAGGGVKGGLRYGATDEHGIRAVENKMHVHDLHATILHLLGLDHERLTYRYAGRDFRLTDVHGVVAKDILA